jgi:hypothetical protein
MSSVSGRLLVCFVVLALCRNTYSTGLEGFHVSRVLLARASASSSATATSTGNGQAAASAVSSAVATGDAEAIAEAISNANAQQGSATANSIAEAITDAIKGGASRDAIATAIAEATSLELDEAYGYLDRQDTEALADAIARSEGGTAYAESISVAQAVARQRNVVIRSIIRVFDFANGGRPARAAIRRSSTAIGEAVAEAFADASVILEVTGRGYVSGTAEANAFAISDAFAQVILEGIARACNKYGVAEASFQGEAISTAIAEASANAFAQAELSGPGYVEAVQNSVAKAVVNPVASILADAVAYAYGSSTSSTVVLEANSSVENEDAFADTQGTSSVDGSGFATASGGADAATQQVKQCQGYARRCCRRDTVYKDHCGCRRRRGCRYEGIEKFNGKTTLWRHTSNGDVCQC